VSTRVTNSMMTRTLLRDLTATSEKLGRTHEKLSSGKSLTRPSDDPFATSRALQFRSDLAVNRQYQRNVAEAASWQGVADTALDKISNYIGRARELLLQGANGSAGPSERSAIAKELEQIVDAVKSEANAQYAGRFVFAGTDTTTRPYTPGGADAYAGNAATISVDIGPGVQLPLNIPGSSVVGDGTTGLIFALREAITDLNAGNVTDLQTVDIVALRAASDNVAELRAVIGARTNRLETADERLRELEEAATVLLSETEDADMARTLTDLSMQQAVYQSALKSGAQIIQPSLIDFLR
jgi:flagellar hook-associated protein 3 FlgL